MAENENESITCFIDGIPYQVRKEPDLSWLHVYGRVFSVLDQQFSGNLCFGVEGPYGRLFIKYAGAQTINYRGKTTDAVYLLQNAMSLYDIKHPALIPLLAHGQAGDGYAAVFAWRDASPLRGQPYDPAVRDALRRLALPRSLKMLDMVFDLHAELALKGIVAVDFYDGNVLIDFARDEALICDIDLYRSKPAFNDRGRMWGSSRFMSPEEYQLSAVLDESTTVYNMAALAFEFYGSNEDRDRKNWIAPYPLWEVAHKSTQESKADRYPSMRAFLEAWREAVGRCRL
ncbi:MAG: serine/threonine protein kinase [Clostridia bacterium]|nr:serine/threonine protein kinase [Clostridia bacterium]